MLKRKKKVCSSISIDYDLLSWASESGNVSGFLNDIIREAFNASRKKDIGAMLNQIENKLEARGNIDKDLRKLFSDLDKIKQEKAEKISEEEKKKVNKYEEKYKNDYSLMEKIEKDIKEHGLEEIKNEMLDAYSKNNKMIENSSEMEKWKKKFKEKYKEFYWGNNLDSYCYHKGKKK